MKRLIFFFAFGLSLAVKAESLVFYTDSWAPYNYVEHNRIVGVSTELLEAALKKTGFQYEIKLQPWKRAYLAVQNTPYTALYTVNRSPQRDHLFKWVGPLYPGHVYLFKLKTRKDIATKTLQDVGKYRIGVLNEGSVHRYLLANGIDKEQLNLVSYSNQHLKMLFAERLDLVPGDEIDFAFQLRGATPGFSDLEKAFMLYEGRYYIALNLDTPDAVITELQQALDQVVAEGARESILEKYLKFSPGGF